MVRSPGRVDDIKMIAWIDKYGDVVWNDDDSYADWSSFLDDGCRLNTSPSQISLLEEDVRINGTWMILE